MPFAIHKTQKYKKQEVHRSGDSVGFSLDELSQDILEDTTVLEVGDFDISVKSDLNLE